MELTREFLEYCKTNKNVWTIQEVIDLFGEKYPQLNIFKIKEFWNSPDLEKELNETKFTSQVIEDMCEWQGYKLVDVLFELIHIYPEDLIIKGFKFGKDSLGFYCINRARMQYKFITVPIQIQYWDKYDVEENIPEKIKKTWKLK